MTVPISPHDELAKELILMADHGTRRLFSRDANNDRMVYAPFSRLVVDVERFEDDESEPMASRGMGVIYTRTAYQKSLRRPLSLVEREDLLDRFYRPHHIKLQEAVDGVLKEHGHCLVLDCHSFPSAPLPYEPDRSLSRPDICIGTDPFHTSDIFEKSFMRAFAGEGYTVAVNQPFSGALVPGKQYKMDGRVKAVMVEVNRSLYLDERTGGLLPAFPEFKKSLDRAMDGAIDGAYDT